MQPTICPECKNFTLMNKKSKPSRCLKCGARGIFYDDPEFDTKYYGLGKVPDDLENDTYICPKCGKHTLKFERTGSWS